MIENKLITIAAKIYNSSIARNRIIEISENKLITIAGKYTGNLKPYLICSTSPFYKATPSETKKLTL
jgi:fructose 1,6-bisphosphatase